MDDLIKANDVMSMNEEQLNMLKINSMRQELLEEKRKKEQEAAIRNGRMEGISNLLGSKMMLCVVIACWITLIISSITILTTIFAFSKASIAITLIIGLCGLIPILVLKSFAHGSLRIYSFKKHQDTEKLYKGVKMLKGGLTFYEVLLSLVLIIVLLLTVLTFAVADLFGGIMDSLSDSTVAKDGLNIIMIIACVFIIIVFSLAFYLFTGSKKIANDVYNRITEKTTSIPKIIPLAVLLLVVGLLLFTGQIMLQILSSMLSSAAQAAASSIAIDGFDEIIKNIANNPILKISEILGYVNAVASFVPFVFGSILLFRYRSLLGKLYSPNYVGQML